MNDFVPKYAFFISGTGSHADRLQAFDQALLDAGPLAHNLVTVSSIMPAACEVIGPEEGFQRLTPGQITFCVMARQDTNVTNEYASAAVGVVKTEDPAKFGYISEYHGDAAGSDAAKEIAVRLAIEMYERKIKTAVKDLAMERMEATAASIKQPGDATWVSAVALCIFVI